ncbi:DUF4825 domain-containing protein [Bacillus spongiae]|uniref:DUF4825 domain-containing protein n=1 Tax=Bacillus spongiae TaxID=2683610 RepID=A0ABU8HBU7_9BACI
MKHIARMLTYLFSLIIVLSGCSQPMNNSNIELFDYKESYIGDNSAVGAIIAKLPAGKSLYNYSLETDEKPFGLAIQYKDSSLNEVDMNETIMYNATFLYALIQNVDRIQFDFQHRVYVVYREDLQKWYSKDLREFETEQKLKEFISEYIRNTEKVEEFFVTY